MDRFERAWYSLTRPSQRWASRRIEAQCAEDLKCDVCGDGETLVNNLIVICDSCDVSVHQECYGVPLIPEGPWLCRKCYLDPLSLHDCVLCPWTRGALKPTTELERPWCHLFCAQLLPGEVQVLNTTYKEPLVIKGIDRGRWELVCQLCRIKKGAPIQCSIKSCHIAIHPKCARKAHCYFDPDVNLYKCWRHSQTELTGIISSKNCCKQPPRIIPNGKSGPRDSPGVTPRKLRKILQHPVLPMFVLDYFLIDSVPCEASDKQKRGIVEIIARFWSLKRSKRRGLPLLKSLQIEQWSDKGALIDINDRFTKRQALLKESRSIECLFHAIKKREKLAWALSSSATELFDLVANPIESLLKITSKKLW